MSLARNTLQRFVVKPSCRTAAVARFAAAIGMAACLASALVAWAQETARKPDRKGWVRCTLPLESIDFGIRELMRLGDEVRVLGPARLRAEFAASAARMARVHRSGDRSGR